jgi:hypothetical protein
MTMTKRNHSKLATAAFAMGTAVALSGASVLPMAVAQAGETPIQLAACKPCNPCAGKNPCAAKKGCNPCAGKNPCAAKKKGCNPCAAKKGCAPCNPCKAK